MELDEVLDILSHIRWWCRKGYPIALTEKELEALDYAMMAVKTVQDLPEAIQQLLTEKEN